MAIVYLEPKDFSAEQARTILEFLNRAPDAQSIAARVEFPDEPDIGVELGRRLLAARGSHGGRFESLEQVAAVRLIGPERFTELCVGVLGADPRALPAPPAAASSVPDELLERLNALERRLAGLELRGQGLQLELGASAPRAWRGQRVELRVRVRDGAGQLLPNQRVTLEARGGLLEGARGYASRRGEAVSLSTGVDGSLRLDLRCQTIEPLTPAQEAALEAALATIDPKADTPELASRSLAEFVRLYLGEREHTLRAAVDISTRRYEQAFLRRVNQDNFGFEWPSETLVVRADCHGAGPGAQSFAQAVLLVSFENWVGAFARAMQLRLSGKDKLGSAFRESSRRAKDGYRALDAVLNEAQRFVAGQPGLVAQWVSQRVVDETITEFLAQSAGQFDAATQQKFFSGLAGAASQLTAESRGTIALVSQTRVDLNDEIKRINTDLGDRFSGLLDSQLAVDSKLAAFDEKFSRIEKDVSRVDTQIGRVQTDISLVQTDLGGVKSGLDKVNIELSTRGGR